MTTENFVGAEMLYKPEGQPSFELISYVVDSNLETIAKVLNESAINP